MGRPRLQGAIGSLLGDALLASSALVWGTSPQAPEVVARPRPWESRVFRGSKWLAQGLADLQSGASQKQ